MVTTDPLLKSFENDDGLFDEGMLELVKSGFRKPPSERGVYMDDYQIVADRVVYDDGEGQPFTVMRLEDLNVAPVQLADAEAAAGGTQTDASPGWWTTATRGIAAAQGVVSEAQGRSPFASVGRGAFKGLLNLFDAVGFEPAGDLRRDIEEAHKLEMKDATPVAKGADVLGEVAGQFLIPGIKFYNLALNMVKGGRITKALPNWVQHAFTAAITEAIMYQADSPENPSLVGMLKGTTTRTAPPGRALLEGTGMQSAQPAYDAIVDYFSTAPGDPEDEIRLKKFAEGALIGLVSTPVIDGFIHTLRHWKKIIAGGGALALASDDAEASPGAIGRIIKFMGLTGDDAVEAAKADTRQGAEIVADRLNAIVPPESRVAGGTYAPRQPDGQPWSALSDDQLAAKGPGFRGSDADIDRMWAEAIAESSAAAKTAVAETGANVTMRSGDWDGALKLPLRAQLWYELSGDAFRRRLPILNKDNNLLITFNDIVGVTSPREKPLDNLRRALAILSQRARREPIDVDVTNPAGVQEALAREGAGSAVAAGNKTGNFADTMSLVAGADVPPPIPVNDIWVGRIFGVNEDQLMKFQSLHEPMALFWNKMRDHVNLTSPDALPHESWQLQARGWVAGRGAQDDYAQSLDVITKQLQDAGIPGVTPDGVITDEALLHPDFVAAIRPTVPPFRSAPKATIEFGTTQTPRGAAAADAAAQLRSLPDDPKASSLLQDYNSIYATEMYHSARGKMNMWDQAYAHVMGITSKTKADVSRISYPRSDRPFDVAGTFEGVFSPNIRVPLRGMSDDQVAQFHAIVGTGLRQDAMASSTIKIIDRAARLSEGAVESRTIFIESAKDIDGSVIEGLYKRLPEGFEISTERVANGYVIDVNPRFTDAGPVGATAKDVREAVKFLKSNGYDISSLRMEYRSVYNEAGEYAAAIEKRKQELLDGATSELQDKLGWTESRARRFLDGRGMGKVSDDVRRKGQRIRASYQGALGTLDGAVRAARQTSDKVDARYGGWLEKYRKYQGRGDPDDAEAIKAGSSMAGSRQTGGPLLSKDIYERTQLPAKRLKNAGADLKEARRAISELREDRRKASSGLDPLLVRSDTRAYRLSQEREQRKFVGVPIASAWNKARRDKIKSFATIDPSRAEAEARRATLEAIERAAEKRNYVVRHKSFDRGRVSSTYLLRPDGAEIRVSDHHLPDTAERFERSVTGKETRWAGEIVVDDWRHRTLDDYMDLISQL